MISHKKQHRYDLVLNGEKLFCFYQINGIDITYLAVYNRAGEKVILPANEEVEVKGKIIAHSMTTKHEKA